MKVRELRKHLYDVYAEVIFKYVDIDDVIKKQIEEKGIVIIDEIDKLVK